MNKLSSLEILRARLHVGNLDPVEALLAYKHHPELFDNLKNYRSNVCKDWNILRALPYRWINTVWFDRQILDNADTIGNNCLLCAEWIRMIPASVKIELIGYLTGTLQYNSTDKNSPYSKICSLIISIVKVESILIVSQLAEQLLSKLSLNNRIVTTISFYIEGVITEQQLEEFVQWDIEHIVSWKDMQHIRHRVHRLPQWLVQSFIDSCDISIDAQLIESVCNIYSTLQWNNIEQFDVGAIDYLLKLDSIKDICNDRNKLLDYEQLRNTSHSTVGLAAWLLRCNPLDDFHVRILKHKLSTLICNFEWDKYGEFICLEWLGGSNIIKNIVISHHTRAARSRIISICMRISENPQLLCKVDPVPLMLQMYPRLSIGSIIQTLSLIRVTNISSISPEHRISILNDPVLIPDGLPQYLLEMLCDVYGCQCVPERSDRVIWNGKSGEDALTLWKTITPNSGTIQFINGDAVDVGGVSREFHEKLGESMIPITGVMDGYKIPTGNGNLWGAVIRRIVMWDRQAIGVDLHPLVCVLICWGWLLHPIEPYPYAVVSALLDRDVLMVLAPKTAYRIIEACTNPETAMQPCVELSEEIHERYLSDPVLLSNLCAMIHTANAPLNISPRRLFNMLAGGEKKIDLDVLFGTLEVKLSIIQDNAQEIKTAFKVAFTSKLQAMREMQSNDNNDNKGLNELYRFWFGTIRPNFDNEAPVLNIVAEMAYPVAKSHVCVSQLNIPYTQNASNINNHVSICIDRAIENQKIAIITGMLYQFK